MSNTNLSKVYEMIKALPCFIEQGKQVINVKRIEAGQSSLCFEVVVQKHPIKDKRTDKTKSYFVKYDENALFFANELTASKAASKEGLSPKVLYAEQQWLVTEYIEGKTLDKTNEAITDKIEVALSLMKKCHILYANVPELNVSEIIFSILKSESFSTIQVKEVEEVISRLPTILTAHNQEHVLCHGDINFSNILIKQDKAMLIDFECTCLAELEFELAMFIAINKICGAEKTYAVNLYNAQREDNKKIDNNKLEHYLLYSYLLNALWYFEKAGNRDTSREKKMEMHGLALEQFIMFDSLFSTQLLASFKSN